MSLNEKDLDMIQRYLDGDLTEADDVQLKSRLDDQEFKEELLFQAQMVDALEEYDYLQIKEELTSDNVTTSTPTPNPSKSSPWKWVLLLLGLGSLLYLGWLGYQDGRQDAQTTQFAELVDRYSTPYPVTQLERGVTTDASQKIPSGMEAYANENWQEALKGFDRLEPQIPQVLLYKANCHIQLKDYKEALAQLSAINTDKEDIIQNKEWYQAISHLGNSNQSDAKRILSAISANRNHLFYNKSINLLKDLN